MDFVRILKKSPYFNVLYTVILSPHPEKQPPT
jgi:hypothetical protein